MASAAEELRLYEITDTLERITDALVENGGELTEELEEAWDAWQGAFAEKAERTALAVRALERRAEMAATEAKRLRALARTRERAAAGLKDYLRHQMARLEVAKLDTPRATIWRQQNGRPSIAWTRPVEELPEPYRRVTVEADTQAAYERWKAGGELPEGFVVERGEHLRIR